MGFNQTTPSGNDHEEGEPIFVSPWPVGSLEELEQEIGTQVVRNIEVFLNKSGCQAHFQGDMLIITNASPKRLVDDLEKITEALANIEW